MKKIFGVLGLAFVCAAQLLAQNTARTFTLQNSTDGESTLQVFLPAPEQATGRAVVACPGGGYSHLAMQHEGTDWAPFFNKKGIAYVVLKYRMPQGNGDIPVQDALNAMKTVRDSAAVWHINPNNVGMMGSSAGGHLAATVSTHADYAHRPNFTILFYPVITMEKVGTHEGSAQNFLGAQRNDDQWVKAFSNEQQVRRHLTPPAVILLSNDDKGVPAVPNGVAYYTAMRNAGNSCAMYIYPTGGHGWGFRPAFQYHEQMLNDLATWLDNLPTMPEKAVRVACIGNSITDGHGIDMAETNGYPALLQRKLGDGYVVKNFGVSGRTLLNEGDLPYTKEMAWKDALAFNPQVVVIKLGTNDTKPQNWVHKANFQNNLQQMIDTLQALPAKPKIFLAYPIKAFKPSWNINEEVIEKEVIPIIAKVAKKNKLPVIDLHSAVDTEALVQPDGIHPNAKGVGVIAEEVYKAVSGIRNAQ